MIRISATRSLLRLQMPVVQPAIATIPSVPVRFISNSQQPPSTKSSQSKPLKATKPSSKANARTSRLLRSQLAPSGSSAPAAMPVDSAPEASNPAGAALAEGDNTQSNLAESQVSLSSKSAKTTTPPPQLQDVLAFATASSYDFDALIHSGRLPPGWRLMEDGQVIYLPSWPPHNPTPTHGIAPAYSSGEVFILRTGAFITWGLQPQQAERFRSTVLSPIGVPTPPVERGSYEEVGEEELEFVVNEKDITRIVGDVLILGQAPPDVDASSDPWSPLLARLSFSAGLALSARMSSQEASLSKYLISVSSLPKLLEEKGRVPISRKEVVRKMGRLLKLRQMVNLDEGSKVEELDLFWENARMEEHYDSICRTLDIEQRFRALNEQLDHAENLMGILRALLTEGSSHRMELIIIALIAIEVTLALFSHKFSFGFGSSETETTAAGLDHGSPAKVEGAEGAPSLRVA